MFDIGPEKLLIILVVALLVVGPKRLPEIGRTLGRALQELRKAQAEMRDTFRGAMDEPPGARPSSPTAPSPAPAGDDGASLPPTSSDASPAETVEAKETSGVEGTATEVARSLGRGLAELRRAREEVQRSFHLDLDDPGRRPG